MAQITLPLDWSRYSKQCHFCNTQIAKTKSDCYTNVVSANADNPRQLWDSITKILHRVSAPTVPSYVSIKSLCDSFSGHFKNKISLIGSALPDHILNHVQVDSSQVNSLLASFTPAAVDDVRNIILSAPK